MTVRALFFGTPYFAVPTLQAMIDSPDIDLRGVLTQPDRPAGRGNKRKPPPVKELALPHGLDLIQPETLKEPQVLPWIVSHEPEAIVVVAYGGFITKTIREVTPFGCINLHPSLLPKYRGAAPMQWAIMQGEKTIGNTTMYLAGGWDNGDIIYQEEEPVHPEDNYGSLSQRLAQKGAQLIVKTLIDVKAGIAPRIPQNDELATFAPLISNEDAHIQWNRPAQEIHDLVRGLNPIPGAFTLHEGNRWKVLRTEVIHAAPGESGRIMSTAFNTIRVSAADGIVEILELQPAGKKAMTAVEYLRGHSPQVGSRCE